MLTSDLNANLYLMILKIPMVAKIVTIATSHDAKGRY
jgi:hypothetical protein